MCIDSQDGCGNEWEEEKWIKGEKGNKKKE